MAVGQGGWGSVELHAVGGVVLDALADGEVPVGGLLHKESAARRAREPPVGGLGGAVQLDARLGEGLHALLVVGPRAPVERVPVQLERPVLLAEALGAQRIILNKRANTKTNSASPHT